MGTHGAYTRSGTLARTHLNTMHTMGATSMRKHTFSTRPAAGMAPVEVTILLPSYDEATDRQRRAVYEDGLFGQGVTVPVQSLMRPRMLKGLSGQALAAFVKDAFDARLAARKLVETPTVDATGMGLTPEQIAGLVAQGYRVIGVEEPETDESEQDEDEQDN